MKMHANQFPIDEMLVRKLIQTQFPQWANLSLKPVLSAGTDHVLYRLGNDKMVRLPHIDWAVDNVDKEYEWLPKIAPFLPVAVSKPLGKGGPTKEYPWPWSVYSWIEGENPMIGQTTEPFVHDLAGFIRALHKIDLVNGPICPRGVPLKMQDAEVRKALQQLKGILDTQKAAVIWEHTLKVPKWPKPPVWMHGDLSPGNLLIKNGRLCGVIDFGNVGIGDPACDLIIAWNLLSPQMRQLFRQTLNVDEDTWQRGCGWALSVALIQLPYYKESNPPLAANARHTLEAILSSH